MKSPIERHLGGERSWRMRMLTVIDLPTLLADLARSRPLFHSEADFQHALAWLIHERQPELGIRLEYRPPMAHERMYVDIWVRAGEAIIALELKYKTRRLQVTLNGEAFDLADQSAQDIGRYDTIKDLCRLERLASAHPNLTAYVVLLTNDSAYWAPRSQRTTVDASFRIDEGRVLTGELAWRPEAGAGTTKTREAALLLSGSYSLRWRDYSTPASGSYGRFRYLAVQVAR